jgi:hypothetical protein
MRQNYTNDYIRGTAQWNKSEKQREMKALRERVPERLPPKYRLTLLKTDGESITLCESDKFFMLYANAGVGADTVRRMIDTGERCKIWDGWMTILPAQGRPTY